MLGTNDLAKETRARQVPGRAPMLAWLSMAVMAAHAGGIDVLDGIEEMKLCTGYKLDGETIDILPMGADEIARCTPVYESMEGWTDSTVLPQEDA